MNVKILKQNVQKDLLARIILNLRHMKLSIEQARRMAREFVAIQQLENMDALFEKLHMLGMRYPEVNEVYQKHARVYFEVQRAYRYEIALKELAELKGGDMNGN